MIFPVAPRIIAHRGASGYRPEHTRSAYELALRLGADAIEPDIVPTADGVLVLRHESEISGTTDVAARSEFASRRRTKMVDGARLTGWFTEDFTWAELRTLRTRERLPKTRPANTAFDGEDRILRLADLFELLDGAPAVGMVAELKHPTYFRSLGLSLEELFAAEVRQAGWPNSGRMVVESFEESVLHEVRERGVNGEFIYLLEDAGAAADLQHRYQADAPSYASQLTDAGLAALAERVDGISVPKKLILDTGHAGHESTLVQRAHAAGLTVFTWTLRAENRFLSPRFRRGTHGADFGDWRGEFGQLLASGVDGVFADQPDLVLHLRDRR